MALHSDDQKLHEYVRKSVAQAMMTDSLMTVSEYADKHMMLPAESASEPGRYRTSRTPYMRDIMDDLSVTSPVQEVCFVAAAQTGKSQGGLAWLSYIMDIAPGPTLMVQSSVDTAKRFSKQRIAPMLNLSPRLSKKVSENRSRDASNTMLEKSFPGGILLMAGANSAAGLRSMPIRYLFLDEVSSYPADADGEGDPVALAIERTNTFSRKKIYKCSTPNKEGICRISADYELTDKRKYHLPCPHCGHFHELLWENFVIPKDSANRYLYKESHMVCPECAGVIEEHHKTEMLEGGKWVATNPDATEKTRRGYQISALYSPVGWKSWEKIARQWKEAQGNPKYLQAFINNVLALPWREASERVDEHELMKRCEGVNYNANNALPEGALILTAGIDTQVNRLEVEVVAWGIGEESWSMGYHVLYGDPNGDLVWQQLDLLLMKEYDHPLGFKLRVARSFVDSGGLNTNQVYAATRTRAHIGLIPIKGVGGDGILAVRPPSGKKGAENDRPWLLGTHSLKDTIYGRLKLTDVGPGYCHFPGAYGVSYFQGLTSEETRIKYRFGRPTREYYVLSGRRNEPLDCRVYAYAALLSMNLNLQQLYDIVMGKYTPEPEKHRGVRAEMNPNVD